MFEHAQVNRTACADQSNPSDQLLERAYLLAQAKGFLDQYTQIRHILGSAVMVLVVLGLIAGGSAALAALGSGQAPVNVIWSLLGLLLMPTMTLLLWIASLALPSAGAPWFGRVMQAVLSRSMGKSALLPGWHAWLDLARQSGTLRLWMGLLSHLVWFALLLGGVITMVAAFSLRHYTFVWETTWLSVDVFVMLASLIGAPASWIGLSMPDAAAIAASGNQAVDDPGIRMLWANWLVGSIAVLGVLPRLVAATGCGITIWLRLRRQTLDPRTAYATAVLAQIRHDLGVQHLDGPPGESDRFEPVARAALDSLDFGGSVTVGVDMNAMPEWVDNWPGLGIVDDRRTRQEVFAQLDAQRPARLLIVVDSGQTPDRGSLSLVRDLAGKADQVRVFMQPRSEGPERADIWRDKLAHAGLVAPLSDQDQAARWLQGAQS